MRVKKCLLTLLVVLVAVLPMLPMTVSATEIDFPKPSYQFYTYDEAGIMDEETESYIVRVNEHLANQTGAQVVVAALPNLQGRTIEEYANLLYREWGIGSKKTNNGILLLVGYEERQVRIEVGYGLEGAVPDITSGKIISDDILPQFKEGDYNQGILNGFNAIMEKVAQEYEIDYSKLAIDTSRSQPVEPSGKGFLSGIGKYILILLLLADIFLNKGRMSRFLLLMFMSGRGRGGGGGSGGGGNFGGGGSSGGGGASGGW